MKKIPMTNYSERLDEILEHLLIDYDFDVKDKDSRTFDRAKQALTSLIRELVAEVKPELPALFTELNDISVIMYKKGTDEFEQNLLKALEEV